MKYCKYCNKNKKAKDFYLRKMGNRAGKPYERCITCMKERGRKYYYENHDRQLRLAINRRHRYYQIKRKLIDSLKNKPCADCGILYPPYVMDFDHINGKIKLGNIGSMITRNLSLKNIKREINKCDLLCANCHRSRTHERKAVVAKVVTAEV